MSRSAVIRQLDETQSAVTETSLLRPPSCRLVDGDRAIGKERGRSASRECELFDGTSCARDACSPQKHVRRAGRPSAGRLLRFVHPDRLRRHDMRSRSRREAALSTRAVARRGERRRRLGEVALELGGPCPQAGELRCESGLRGGLGPARLGCPAGASRSTKRPRPCPASASATYTSASSRSRSRSVAEVSTWAALSTANEANAMAGTTPQTGGR